jgi:hypothetical protein
MVTVVDPNGTPAPVYTRSGTTIQDVTANGNGGGAPTPIVSVSGHSIVIADAFNPSNEDVELPSGAEVGDLVEVYAKTNSLRVWAAAGDAINGTAGSVTNVEASATGRMFRKVSSTVWRFI